MPRIGPREVAVTSLDASALVTDVEGLDFLACVLEVSTVTGSPKGAFDIGAPRPGWTISGADVEVIRSGPDLRVAEAA